MPKVLVVDDDHDMLTLVRAALEKDGHQVDTEADSAVVQPTRCRQYDLLLFDVMMPRMDFLFAAVSVPRLIAPSCF